MSKCLTTLGLLALASMVPAVRADVTLDQLRPGLIATFQDATGDHVVRLEPIAALGLGKGEASHPWLGSEGGTVHWQGYLNVLQPGDYRFSVMLRGRVRVRVGKAEVLAGEVAGETAAAKEGGRSIWRPTCNRSTWNFTGCPELPGSNYSGKDRACTASRCRTMSASTARKRRLTIFAAIRAVNSAVYSPRNSAGRIAIRQWKSHSPSGKDRICRKSAGGPMPAGSTAGSPIPTRCDLGRRCRACSRMTPTAGWSALR